MPSWPERSGPLATLPTLVPVAPAERRLEVRVATLLKLALGPLLLANLGRIPVFSTGGRDVDLLANDISVMALVLLGGVAMLVHRRLRIDAVAGFALLFAGVGAISALLAIPRFGLTSFAAMVSMGYLARWMVYLAIYVVVINTVRASDVEGMWRAMETAILLFAAFGIFQSAFLPGFAQMVYPDSRPYLDWDRQGHRLVSSFLDPNFAGAFIDIGLIVGLSRLAAGARVASWKLILLGVALVLTASRGSVLAFLVGGTAILIASGVSKRLLRAIGASAVLVALALPALIDWARSHNKLTISDPSALQRVIAWAHGWQVLQDHWVLGIGFNTWGYVAERYGWTRSFTATYAIDGGLFFVLVMTGIVGLAFYIAMLTAIGFNARRVWRDRRFEAGARGIAIGAAAMIPTIVVHSLFTNSLLHPFLMETLWILWALPFLVRTDARVANA